jgi:hypothetical protein
LGAFFVGGSECVAAGKEVQRLRRLIRKKGKRGGRGHVDSAAGVEGKEGEGDDEEGRMLARQLEATVAASPVTLLRRCVCTYVCVIVCVYLLQRTRSSARYIIHAHPQHNHNHHLFTQAPRRFPAPTAAARPGAGASPFLRCRGWGDALLAPGAGACVYGWI